MFKFKITRQSKDNLGRTGLIKTTHAEIETPAFIPCATVGAVKGISAEELQELGFNLILANTYHLYLRPGEKPIKKLGGIQKFMNWPGAILTDSGGYQVFSLGEDFKIYNKNTQTNKQFNPGGCSDNRLGILRNNRGDHSSMVQVTKNGVWFRSHLDGSKHFFNPEKVIDIQKDLGSDIIMVLDECTEYPATKERAKKSMLRTHQWAKEALRARRSGQALFGIVQGSTYKDLREESAKFISSLPFDGIAVGGVSVGEGKERMYEVMKWVGPLLPKDRPHYLMGVGEPEDIIEAVKWGFDMFDCILPTRLGRHGTVWVTSNWQKFPKIDLRKSKYQTDKNPIMNNCGCPACSQGYTKAYISHLIKNNEMLGLRLASLHNLWILSELMRRIRSFLLA